MMERSKHKGSEKVLPPSGFSFGNTPLIAATIYKRSQIVGHIDLLPDSGSSLNLMHVSVFKKLGLPFRKVMSSSYDIRTASTGSLNIVEQGAVKLKVKTVMISSQWKHF